MLNLGNILSPSNYVALSKPFSLNLQILLGKMDIMTNLRGWMEHSVKERLREHWAWCLA